MNGQVLIDHSAWTRLQAHSLPEERAAEIAAALEAKRIAVCLPFLLEAGFSARSATDHYRILSELLTLPRVVLDEAAEDRALAAQEALARSGHHRLPPPDLLIAALADQNGMGVLHYDSDFDHILAHTDLDFASVWLAPRGSLS